MTPYVVVIVIFSILAVVLALTTTGIMDGSHKPVDLSPTIPTAPSSSKSQAIWPTGGKNYYSTV